MTEGRAQASQEFTIDDVLNELGFGSHQKLLMVLCGAGWAADIMDIQAVSFLLPTLRKEWNATNERLGLVASFTFFGMLLGSIFWGVISDRIGRRPAFMVAFDLQHPSHRCHAGSRSKSDIFSCGLYR